MNRCYYLQARKFIFQIDFDKNWSNSSKNKEKGEKREFLKKIVNIKFLLKFFSASEYSVYVYRNFHM